MSGTLRPGPDTPPTTPPVSNAMDGGTAYGPVVQAGTISGLHLHPAAPAVPPVPRQLPAAAPLWVDRREDLAWLHRACGHNRDEVTVAVVWGPGGAGKTALASRFLRTLPATGDEPHLYVDLRGHNAADPVTPVAALARFLADLGVAGTHVPSTADGLAAMWRTVTAGRRIAQVRPLIPGGPAARVVVTSRTRLDGLVVDGAEIRRLGPLPQRAAVDLLVRRTRRTSTADRAAAGRIAHACAGMPLALHTVAAQHTLNPALPLQRLADRLTANGGGRAQASARPGPYDPEHDQEHAVQMSISSTYQVLPELTRTAYQRLGALPATILDTGTVAAACDLTPAQANWVLTSLDQAGLLQSARPAGPPQDAGRYTPGGVYRFPDPVREHARATAEHGLGQADRDDAVLCWAQWLLAAATDAESFLTPCHRRLERVPVPPTYVSPFVLPDPGQEDTAAAGRAVTDWLEVRWPDLTAAAHAASALRRPDLAWQLVDAVWPVIKLRRPADAVTLLLGTGLPAARADGNGTAARRMLTTAAGRLRHAGDYPSAIRLADEARASADAAGDPRDLGQAAHEAGAIHLEAGRPVQAVPLLREALAARSAVGDPRGAALTRILLGNAASGTGDHNGARDQLGQALRDLTALGERYEAARAMAYLGRAHRQAGRYTDSETWLRAAAQQLTQSGSAHWPAHIQEFLGETAEAQGRTDQALTHYRTALAAYRDLHATRDTHRLQTAIARLGAGQ
ncbi:Tetratricopeptide repeat-containing protein [Actinacidiphila alni]|uniref:Tetratricopeptide repeat-containing protein n=1 Tax=Actinacidiphila alni TaxID=380248 RepID=A0A1I2L7B5_9ACTN|nr:tetratricopeptide repeat protein [Actinacidiphila alni]SFF75222.1 Tetratricopeptide repeat-containing protein [Actinacidiphila alni]